MKLASWSLLASRAYAEDLSQAEMFEVKRGEQQMFQGLLKFAALGNSDNRIFWVPSTATSRWSGHAGCCWSTCLSFSFVTACYVATRALVFTFSDFGMRTPHLPLQVPLPALLHAFASPAVGLWWCLAVIIVPTLLLDWPRKLLGNPESMKNCKRILRWTCWSYVQRWALRNVDQTENSSPKLCRSESNPRWSKIWKHPGVYVTLRMWLF